MKEKFAKFTEAELEQIEAGAQKEAKGGVWPIILGGLAIAALLTSCQSSDGGEFNNGCANTNCGRGGKE